MRRTLLLLLRSISRLATAGSAIFGVPLYALSGFSRRRPSHVVFGGNGDRFTDNAKHLFLHVSADPRFTATWVSGDRHVVDTVRRAGLRAERRWSPRGMAAAVRAGWIVYGAYPSDVNFWLSRGARLLNLWHGVPLKAIEFDVTSGPLARVYASAPWSPLRLAFLDRFKRPDLVVSTSRFLTERCFTSAFRVAASQCIEVGYPRTDRLLSPSLSEAAAVRLGIAERVAGAAQIIGYFPTWRDDGHDFLGAAKFSFDEMNHRLQHANRRLIFKAHPNFGDLVPRDRSWSNVVILDPAVDLNEVLPLCDVLVTDYSSVAFDFLLLDRPVIYFLPDHERYVGRRNLYFEIEEMTAGPVVTTSAELYDALAGPIPDDHAAARHRLRSLVWGDYAGGACERLADVIAGTT